MQVLKFGGSSIADAKKINKVVAIVKEAVSKDKTILVCSAISKCTDKLIAIGNIAAEGNQQYEELIALLEKQHEAIIDEIIPAEHHNMIKPVAQLLFNELRDVSKGVFLLKELSAHTLDHIMSFGELLSTNILKIKFWSLGVNCKWVDSREIIKTNNHQSINVVDTEKTYNNIKGLAHSNNYKLLILPGFIASDSIGRTTTLGRGGSDYSAALFAVGAQARILEIWTDVNGMMTCDPRVVPQTKTIRNISYKEALELSHFGAKVVYPPTIQPVVNKGIPILVKNTFNVDEPGTLIENNPPESHNKIKGISSSDSLALISMEGSGMVGIPGYSAKLFDVLARNNINIILITQASSVNTMLVAIEQKDAEKAKKAVDELFAYEISLNKVEPLKVEKGFSIISLVGDDMKNQSGTSGRMFDALGKEGINIRAIAQGSSEKNVSAVVHTKDVEFALKAVHKEFFDLPVKKINLYMAGYGNVGKELVHIINKQAENLLRRLGIEIKLTGICNSKKMLFNKDGINIHTLTEELNNGAACNMEEFILTAAAMGLKNSVFVDCTSDRNISYTYPEILSKKINIVTCNKIANSESYEYYSLLKEIARKENLSYYYETNVGAALPIISTIQSMRNAGDKIQKIEAILSGTLNYLFSNYKADDTPFYKILLKAKELGYTEPDPRIDLKGVDVLRKTIILAREIGLKIDEKQIMQKEFVPKSVFEGGINDFYKKLEKHEAHFKALFNNVEKAEKKLVYMAKITDEEISIGHQEIDKSHPFYALSGTDNAVSIWSDNYANPIIIQGAGAGAHITATGLFNDVLRVL
ncbi:MAG: bifunctional aspartate kinase/homoserine dehydrogenase I [Prevotellaceae bacterium]|jgi:aspartokinase/homoserine dehydrogenase 1|nr:bifunctional aspartate kinase/homoserine dehydrogenase I [Prevotellaceae bacterium]